MRRNRGSAMDPDRFQKLMEIFDAARLHAPAARRAYLESACADDPELAREVAADQPQERLARPSHDTHRITRGSTTGKPSLTPRSLAMSWLTYLRYSKPSPWVIVERMNT